MIVNRLFKEEKGTTAIEYGVLTGFAFVFFYIPVGFVFEKITIAFEILKTALDIV